MGTLTNTKKTTIPTMDELLLAHKTLTALLKNKKMGLTPPPAPLGNKLDGLIAAPAKKTCK